MELPITGRNLEITDELRRYLERKLGKLGRHLPSLKETKVEIREEKTKSPEQRFVVQVTADVNGTLLRGEERGEDLFTAIDRVAAVMDRQVAHYKGKRDDKGRGISLARGDQGPGTASLPPLIKVKRFTVEPMSVAEAIERMELLGHTFYLFLNADTDEINVAYRRQDEGYGVIEAEME
ncbi:MAG: ribosome-associated translation inhibitor RaiA [Chloroflexota bacterium]